MNEDIIKWAQLSGLMTILENHSREFGDGVVDLERYEEVTRFAALVRADEREACAKVCEARYMGDNNREDMEARRCAAAIRARSQA